MGDSFGNIAVFERRTRCLSKKQLWRGGLSMETKIQRIDRSTLCAEDVREAAGCLQHGGLVAFPTETVYGLGGNAFDETAAARIYAAKGRPSDNPLIVHIAEVEALEGIVMNVSDKAKKVIDKFWPGPLTLIFEKTEKVPYGTTGGLDTVAVRMPVDDIALALIRAGGGYISDRVQIHLEDRVQPVHSMWQTTWTERLI
jgi:L-threonylcarbamoyladenylate synthase